MKTIKILAGALLAILAISCSSDDSSPSYPLENPLESYHQQAGFTTTTNFIDAGNYEFGLAFSPNVKGVINAITIKLPAVNPTLKVTIWDYDTKQVLRTEVIDVSTKDVLFTKTIPELALEKDKKYMITMNSNDWYKNTKADNTNAIYPITAGNIKFLEYRWLGGATQVFPTNISLNYNGGDLSFNFKQTK